MSIETRVAELIDPTLEGMAYRLVRVQLNAQTLQIMADRHDNLPMTLNDCEKISQTVSLLLDVADPISTPYSLEVSSPGIDRPLTRFTDFGYYIGHVAHIELSQALEGRRHFRNSTIQGLEGDNTILLVCDNKSWVVPYHLVAKAKLILTDELIDAHLAAQKQALEAAGITSLTGMEGEIMLDNTQTATDVEEELDIDVANNNNFVEK
jgi:ribosome maturation factor RimP